VKEKIEGKKQRSILFDRTVGDLRVRECPNDFPGKVRNCFRP